MKATTNGPDKRIGTTTPNTIRDMRTAGERSSSNVGDHYGDLGEGQYHLPEGAPVMWILSGETAQRSGPGQWRGNNVRRLANGRIERLPSVAHTSECDYTARKVHRSAHRRYRMVIDHHGHLVAQLMSNAAAHIPSYNEMQNFSPNPYAQYALTKAYQFGWIPAELGCLVRLAKAGVVRKSQLLVSLDGAKVCAKDSATCKHLDEETAARREKNAAAMARLEAHYKPQETKRDEEQATILNAIHQLLAERR